MKLIQLTDIAGENIAIPVHRITAIREADHKHGKCEIFNGVVDDNGNENFWVVKEHYREVWMMLLEVIETETPAQKDS